MPSPLWSHSDYPEAIFFTPLNCICAHLHPYHWYLIPRTQRAEAGFDSSPGTSSISKLAQGWPKEELQKDGVTVDLVRLIINCLSLPPPFPHPLLHTTFCSRLTMDTCYPGRLTLAWPVLLAQSYTALALLPAPWAWEPPRLRMLGTGGRECAGRLSSLGCWSPAYLSNQCLQKTDLFQVINITVWDLDNMPVEYTILFECSWNA